MFSCLTSSKGKTICVCSDGILRCSRPLAAVIIVFTLCSRIKFESVAAFRSPSMSYPVLLLLSAGKITW